MCLVPSSLLLPPRAIGPLHARPSPSTHTRAQTIHIITHARCCVRYLTAQVKAAESNRSNAQQQKGQGARFQTAKTTEFIPHAQTKRDALQIKPCAPMYFVCVCNLVCSGTSCHNSPIKNTIEVPRKISLLHCLSCSICTEVGAKSGW